MAAIDIAVRCHSRATVSFGVGPGYTEVAGGGIASWSTDPNRPRSCGGSLKGKRRVQFVIGGSVGQFFNIGINRQIEETVADDNFDCVFENGDTVTLQGITLLFFKIGRIVYNLKHLQTSRLLLELNLGLEISNIILEVE